MSDLVEDFLAREKDGLAGLEDEIPQAFQGMKNFLTFHSLLIVEIFDDFNF